MDIRLACADLSQALEFYTGELEFRVDAIYPADAPRVVRLFGHGLQILLELNERSPKIPPYLPSLLVSRSSTDTWGTGRAGMHYRDLIPDRIGGRFIASHIRIPNGGPVPDYVHHHDIALQMIYCYRGWVRVVYEDQGEPFVMQAGDCVLQPPHIRHRVLECSDQMEVIEISCPAEHETFVDHDMKLPTSKTMPDRDFAGQRFVRHQHQSANWIPGPVAGFEARDLGIERATTGVASAKVIRPIQGTQSAHFFHDTEFCFNFVLQGSVTLTDFNNPHWMLSAGDSFVFPANQEITLSDSSNGLEILQLTSELTVAAASRVSPVQ